MQIQRKVLVALLASALGAAVPVYAQEAAPPDQPDAGAPNMQEANPPDMQQAPPQRAPDAAPPAAAPSRGWRRFGGAPPMQAAPVPAKLTLPAGSWVTIYVNQPLSSDRNQAGDFFAATLAQPVVVDGIVVARRGQMVGGVVSEAAKAGRAKGVSHLGLQLTELSLVDGRQVTVQTTLMQRRGDTSVGRDAAAIGTTTGVGAAIGAAADGGVGAGIGAATGAVASTVGVLLTRGKPTIVFPEQPLTFRLEAPVTISTVAAPDAFQPVGQGDYGARMQYRAAGPSQASPYYYGGYGYGGYGYGGYGYGAYGYYPYWNPYGWYGPYWYPGVYLGFGGFYGGGFRGFHGGGFHGGGRH